MEVQVLLTAREAARALRISPRKLWTLTKCKRIKATLIPPRSVRYDLADLQDFVDRCKNECIAAESIDLADPAS